MGIVNETMSSTPLAPQRAIQDLLGRSRGLWLSLQVKMQRVESPLQEKSTGVKRERGERETRRDVEEER